MKHLQAEKDIFFVLMSNGAILGGHSGGAVLHTGTTAPPLPRGKAQPDSTAAVCGCTCSHSTAHYLGSQTCAACPGTPMPAETSSTAP